MKSHPLEVSFNPYGLKVLVVDNDRTSLFLLSTMLKSCHYQVTPCTRPTDALSLIRNCEIEFDIVITAVNFFQDMNGIEFLEIVQCETDLPVVVVSAEDRVHIMIEYVIKGACDYLQKPVRMEVIQLLWQHVARKKIFSVQRIGNVEYSELNSSSSGEDKEFDGSSDGVRMEDEKTEVCGKKNRVVWTDDLHHKFVAAVKQLGIQKAVPKKVLELMNVPGLRRQNVASHLQKYRLNLRKLAAHMQERFTSETGSVSECNGSSQGTRTTGPHRYGPR